MDAQSRIPAAALGGYHVQPDSNRPLLIMETADGRRVYCADAGCESAQKLPTKARGVKR